MWRPDTRRAKNHPSSYLQQRRKVLLTASHDSRALVTGAVPPASMTIMTKSHAGACWRLSQSSASKSASQRLDYIRNGRGS